MGFSGGGSNITKAHTHSSSIVQDGGALNFSNVTQAGMAAGDITYSNGTALQILNLGNASDSLAVNAGATAPEWVTASGGQTFGRGVKKITELITNDSTLSDDNDLIIAVNANKTYGFLLMLNIQSDNVPKFKYAFSLPAGASGSMIAGAWDATTATGIGDVTTSVTVDSLTSPSEGDYILPIIGKFVVAGTAGNIALQWAQAVSNAGNTRLYAGSYFVLWEETT